MKTNVLALVTLLLLLTAPASVQAQSGSGNGYEYSINALPGNTITITNYVGPGGAVVIPSNINNLAVTVIGNGDDYPFAASGVTSLTIPDSVTSIADGGFAGCMVLTNIIIPNSVTFIGDSAFDGCTEIPKISLPSGLTGIGNYLFVGCHDLASVTIPAAVTNIGDYAFFYCISLNGVTIPASVTNIGYEAFLECYSMTTPIFLEMRPPSLGRMYFMGTPIQQPTICPGPLGGVISPPKPAFRLCFGTQ
jgi:hypothetical protein